MQSLEIFIFHTALYQRESTAKIGLSNHEEKLIHSRQVSLFPQLSQSLFDGLLDSVART